MRYIVSAIAYRVIKSIVDVENEQFPFLDTLVIRKDNNKLEFDEFRKKTNICRYILNNSLTIFNRRLQISDYLSFIFRAPQRFEHNTGERGIIVI